MAPTAIQNRILRVDLTERRCWSEQPGDAFFRKHLGGRNFIAHYLLTETPRGADAFDPVNRLVFAMGSHHRRCPARRRPPQRGRQVAAHRPLR